MTDEDGQPITDGDGQPIDGTREITGFVTYSGEGFAVVRPKPETGEQPVPTPASNRRYLRDGLPGLYRDDDFTMRFIGALGTYGIPPTNPFAASNNRCNANGTSTNTQPCSEIFAIGLRNPWRWSFDRATAQLWVGDVGQGAMEEVDRVDLGGNYGWRCFEGTRDTGLGCGMPGPTSFPVAEYGRSVGASVTGGYVYRGTRFPGLVGRYIFADFVSGTIFSIDATAQGTLQMTAGFSSGLSISSFGQGLDGELFVVDYNGGLYHIRQ